MEFKDLKSAWDTYSSQEVDKHRLGKESINELLRHRTRTLVDKIDRNIRIGLGILLVYIAYLILDDLYLSKSLSKMIIAETVEYPRWLYPLDIFSILVIIATYLFFVIRYMNIKKHFSVDLHLNDFLSGILETMNTYRRMFYLAVIILLIDVSLAFTAGMYQGIKYSVGNLPGGMDNLSTQKILMIVGVGLAILIPVIAALFFILRWGFNKLYGRYLVKLNETIKELNESGTYE